MRPATLTLLLAAAVGVWKLGPALPIDWSMPATVQEGWKVELAEQTDPSTGYLLTGGRKLVYTVPPGTPSIKLVSNANLRDLAGAMAARTAKPRKRWNYALAIEIRSGGGPPFFERAHHYRGDFTEYLDASGRTYPGLFYLGRADTPLDGRITVLDASRLAGEAQLTVRLKALDGALSGVLLRVYVPERTEERRLAHLWGHISDEQKRILARGSIYPPELLREEEKRNLLRHRWQPLGPIGDRRDLEARTLYVLKENASADHGDSIAPAGVLADRGRIAVIPLPEQGGKLRLRLEQTTAPGPKDGTVRLRWFGPGPHARQTLDIAWQAPSMSYEQDFGGGLLQLEAPRELVIRAYLIDHDQEQEITPAPVLLRGYFGSAAQAVEYAITHLGEGATPFKADFRQVLPRAFPTTPLVVEYSLLGEHGVAMRTGKFRVATQASRYDSLIGEVPGLGLSDPETRYFALPPEVSRVRFRLVGAAEDQRLLVFGATSPPDWVRTQRVPEEQFDFDSRRERILAWFPLRPEGYERYVLSGSSRLVALQPRPPEADPWLSGGLYQWNDYHPNGAWHGRQALLAREPGLPYREEALPATYAELPPGRERLFEFPSYHGLEWIAPGLAWLAEREGPAEIRVYVDGRLHLATRVVGSLGELRLPLLAAGRHRLRVEGPGRYFVNHTRVGASGRVKRLVVRFHRPLYFWHERTTTEAEHLTLRYFPTAGAGRSLIRVRIEGGPDNGISASGWLFRDRLYDIRHDPSSRCRCSSLPASASAVASGSSSPCRQVWLPGVMRSSSPASLDPPLTSRCPRSPPAKPPPITPHRSRELCMPERNANRRDRAV